MKSGNTNPPSDQTQNKGAKAPEQNKERASVSGSNAKPSSSRSANQGEKKTTGGSKG